MASSSDRPSTSESLSNRAAVFDDVFREAFQNSSRLMVAAPVAILGGLFLATGLGALSYRRAARQLSRSIPAPAPVLEAEQEVKHIPRASDFLTPREAVTLFVGPGVVAAMGVASLGGLLRWSLDANSMEEAVREIRWLAGSGPRRQYLPQKDVEVE